MTRDVRKIFTLRVKCQTPIFQILKTRQTSESFKLKARTLWGTTSPGIHSKFFLNLIQNVSFKIKKKFYF
uniref:Uncharacterized protein n=1 Tax=Meloidogyne enterolobii TaxID=390850 RepID=A0A6V7VCA3_MELEN|nr:unnamed protein product [Meloidogyne enterolobii]